MRGLFCRNKDTAGSLTTKSPSSHTACFAGTTALYTFSIFGITSVLISLSERIACSNVSVPKNR